MQYNQFKGIYGCPTYRIVPTRSAGKEGTTLWKLARSETFHYLRHSFTVMAKYDQVPLLKHKIRLNGSYFRAYLAKCEVIGVK